MLDRLERRALGAGELQQVMVRSRAIRRAIRWVGQRRLLVRVFGTQKGDRGYINGSMLPSSFTKHFKHGEPVGTRYQDLSMSFETHGHGGTDRPLRAVHEAMDHAPVL